MSLLIDMTGWIMKEHGVPDSLLTVIERDFEKEAERRKINPNKRRTYTDLKKLTIEDIMSDKYLVREEEAYGKSYEEA